MTDSNDKAPGKVYDETSLNWQDREAYYPWAELRVGENEFGPDEDDFWEFEHDERCSVAEQVTLQIHKILYFQAEMGLEGTLVYELRVPAPIRND